MLFKNFNFIKNTLLINKISKINRKRKKLNEYKYQKWNGYKSVNLFVLGITKLLDNNHCSNPK